MSQVGATSVFHSGRVDERKSVGRESAQSTSNDASAGVLPAFADLLSVNKRPIVAALDRDATSIPAPGNATTHVPPDAHDSRLRQMNTEANAARRSQRRGLAADGRAAGVRDANGRASRFEPSAALTQPPVASRDVGATQGAAVRATRTDVSSPGIPAGRAEQGKQASTGNAAPSQNRFGPDGGTANSGSTQTGLANERSVQPIDARSGGNGSTQAQPSEATSPARAVEGTTEVTTNAAEQIGKLLGAKAGPPQADRSVEVQPVVGDRGAAQSRDGQSGPRAGGKADKQPDTQQPNAKTETNRPAARSEFERLVESIRIRGGHDRSTARMRLQPPELGRIQIDVRLDGDRLDLRIEAESRGAEEVLRARIGQLRDAFAQHGIHLGRMDIVTVDHDAMLDSPDGRNTAADADDQAMREWGDSGEREQGSGSSGSAGGGPVDPQNDAAVESEQVFALDALLEAYGLLDVVA